MDFEEFEIGETSLNPDRKYNDEIEYVVEQLNYIAHAGGRYSRSVQLPIAIAIVNKLREYGEQENSTSAVD